MSSTRIDATLNFRPVKTAFFIVGDDYSLYRDVLQLVCTQWGGIYQLIIPLGETNSIPSDYQEILRRHVPDRFVFCKGYDYDEVAIEEKNALTEELKITLGTHHIHMQWWSIYSEQDNTTHALNAIPDDELQQTLAIWKLGDECKLADIPSKILELAIYGGIYPGQEKYYDDNIVMFPREITTWDEMFWGSQSNCNPYSSVLNITSYNITAHRVVSGNPYDKFDYYDIVIIRSVADLCWYWNLRAIREESRIKRTSFKRKTICLPIDLVSNVQCMDTLFDVIKHTLTFPGRGANCDVIFHWYSAENDTEISELIDNYNILEPLSDKQIQSNPQFGDSKTKDTQPRSIDHLFYLINTILMPKSYEVGIRERTQCQITEFDDIYRIDYNPPETFHNRNGQTVMLDIISNVWNQYPKSHPVATMINRDCHFSQYGISVGMHQYERSASLPLQLPTVREAIVRHLRLYDYEVRYGRVSQYSGALMSLLGGLEGVSLIASEAAHSLLNILAQNNTDKLAQKIAKILSGPDNVDKIEPATIVERLHDSEFEIPPELELKPKTFKDLLSDERIGMSRSRKALLQLLHNLIDRSILKRGYDISCPNCGSSSWYPLHLLGELLTCPGCAHVFMLPVMAGENATEELQWRYVLNTTVNRAVDQDTLVAILAAYYLNRKLLNTNVLFGVELWQGNKSVTDLDFLFIRNNKLIAGECKSGKRLREKDYTIIEAAKSIGLSEFYFCTVQEFDDDVLQKIDELKKTSDIQIGVLSKKQLLNAP